MAVELGDEAGGEFRAVLHEEINRMSREARMALVMCDMEGCSTRVAARQLGWSAARLERRLVQARRRLQDRLALRGISPTGSCELGALLPIGKSMVSRHLIEATVALARARRRPYGLETAEHPPSDLIADLTRSALEWSPAEWG
jgi:hypothetical protein